MKSDKAFVNHAAKRKTIKKFNELLINLLVIFVNAFLAKIEVARHLKCFVISANHDDILRKVNFQTTQ